MNQKPQTAPAPACTRQTKILIVDDDRGLSSVAKLFLEKIAHYEVEVVNDPCLAISRAQIFHPDAMLLDVDMPGKDGGQLAAEVGAHPALRHIPILFFTGLVPHSEAGRHEVMRGGSLFLAKPLNPNALVDALRRLLSSARVPFREAQKGTTFQPSIAASRTSASSFSPIAAV